MEIAVLVISGIALVVAIVSVVRTRRDALEMERYLKELQSQEDKRLRYPFI